LFRSRGEREPRLRPVRTLTALEGRIRTALEGRIRTAEDAEGVPDDGEQHFVTEIAPGRDVEVEKSQRPHRPRLRPAGEHRVNSRGHWRTPARHFPFSCRLYDRSDVHSSSDVHSTRAGPAPGIRGRGGHLPHPA